MATKLRPAPHDLTRHSVEVEEEPTVSAHSCKRRLSTKLLAFAILFEVIAVAAGLAIALGSLYEAIEAAPEHTPGLLLNATLGAVPFVLVAITEGAKIPLTFGFFNASSAVWKGIIGLTLLAIAGITFETAATGFERAYTVRAAAVEAVQNQLASTDRRIGEIKDQTAALSKHRDELITQQHAIDTQEMQEIEQHTERCKAVGKACNSKPYIDEIRLAAQAKRAPLRSELAAIDSQLNGISLTPLLDERASQLSALTATINSNQIYRLAARIYGKPPEELTVAEAALVGKVWFGSIGVIVAVTGIVLAGTSALLSRPMPKPGKIPQLLRRVLLSWRKRARVKVRVEVPGPETIVEKPVEKLVDRVRKIIVYVPEGYRPDYLDKADIEAEVAAKIGPHGRVELHQVGGYA